MDLETAREHLTCLAEATGSVSLGPVGVAATVTPECAAYRALLSSPVALETLRGELESLASVGPGARRIYAALLLLRIDRELGETHLRSMLGSGEPCGLFPGGCSKMTERLGETAGYLLDGPPFLHGPGADPRPARSPEGWWSRLLQSLERLLD
jgi:hypothetical protein